MWFIYQPNHPWTLSALDRRGSWVERPNLDVAVNSPSGESGLIRHVNNIPGDGELAIFNAHWGTSLSLPMEGCYVVATPVDRRNVAANQLACGAIQDVPLNKGQLVLVGTGGMAAWVQTHLAAVRLRTAFPADFRFVVGARTCASNGRLYR